MPFNFKEIFVAALLPAFKEVGKLEMAEVLAGIKEHNTPEVYENTLKSINSNFTLLKEITNKTKTKIDDGLVDIILESVKDAAEADGIEL